MRVGDAAIRRKAARPFGLRRKRPSGSSGRLADAPGIGFAALPAGTVVFDQQRARHEFRNRLLAKDRFRSSSITCYSSARRLDIG